jgi:hypothetical protein
VRIQTNESDIQSELCANPRIEQHDGAERRGEERRGGGFSPPDFFCFFTVLEMVEV